MNEALSFHRRRESKKKRVANTSERVSVIYLVPLIYSKFFFVYRNQRISAKWSFKLIGWLSSAFHHWRAEFFEERVFLCLVLLSSFLSYIFVLRWHESKHLLHINKYLINAHIITRLWLIYRAYTFIWCAHYVCVECLQCWLIKNFLRWNSCIDALENCLFCRHKRVP